MTQQEIHTSCFSPSLLHCVGGIGKTWLRQKDEKILIPEGLRERDFKVFPAAETKKIGPKFGTTAGEDDLIIEF